jgi:replicative DNA helicase
VTRENNELTTKPISVYTTSYQEKVRLRWDGQATEEVVPTGLKHIDETINGLTCGELIVLGARVGVGKTSLAQRIAFNIAERECTKENCVVFYSLEMGHDQLINNLVSQNSPLRMDHLKRTYKNLTKAQKTKLDHELERALDRIDKTNFLIDTSTGLSAEDIRERVKQVRTVYQPRLIVVDYLTLLRELNPNKTTQENVAKSVRILHEIALDNNCPLLCLAQLNRSVETDPNNPLCVPELKHLRDTAQTEQEANLVMFLYRPSVYMREHTPPDEKNLTWLLIAKNRQGVARKRIPLLWQADHTRYADISDDEFDKFKKRNALEY